MDPASWERLEALFFRALELPEPERRAFLEAACAGDDALRAEVEEVLAAHLAAAPAPGDEAADEDRDEAPDFREGTRVGAWLLEELLGRGGMGDVYRARRADRAYEQQVAVKLVRSGLRTVELVRRFRLERQILARLQHPDIATLLDGGVTDDGQPFLVMEYVDGEPLTEFADRRRLPLPDRLALFVRVCRAVQFAHARLVVHRDLKASNILVTGDGQPRLLDFGIAKLLDPGEASDAVPTESLLLLTPEHAAPEQFLGLPITTATDVYQLGVLLYELLAGTRPFAAASPLAMHRAICEEDPPPPSIAFRSGAGEDPDAPAAAARERGTGPEGLRRALRGDLDRIVLMALRKEPGERYASVAELADDVERHLAGFPVRARPHGLGYVATRFVRRHRLAVASGAALAAALVALVALSLRFAATTSRQAAALAEERDVAVEVSAFLESLFEAADPLGAGPARRDTLPIRDFLDEGAGRVRGDLGGQPLLQARLLTTLGNANQNLGRLDASEELLREAAGVLERELGPAEPRLASVRTDLARVLLRAGRYEDAEAVIGSSVDALLPDSLVHAPILAAALSIRGHLRQEQGAYPEAEADYRRALALAETDTAVHDGRMADHLSNLATALSRQARWGEAEALLRRAVELARSHHGSGHPRTASALNNLGIVLREQERLDEAEGPLREALDIRRGRLEPPHPDLAVSVNNVAELTLARGDAPAAEPLFRESLELRRALYGDLHPAVGIAQVNLGAVLHRLGGRTEEALATYAEARSTLATTLGPTHPLVGALEGNVGRLRHEVGDHAAALTHLLQALEIRRMTFDDADPRVLGNLSDVGGCLLELGRHEEAEARLLEAYAGLEPRRDEHAGMWDSVLVRLARLYRAAGREEEAHRYESMRSVREG